MNTTNTNHSYRYSQLWFWYRCTFPYWNHWDIKYTRKGLVKHTIAKSLKLLAFTAVLLGLFKARQRGINPWEVIKNFYGMANMMTLKLLALYGIDNAKKTLQSLRARLLATL
jgi:hypothetical protein